jgi:ABC-2 type transport system ATP-binding protein
MRQRLGIARCLLCDPLLLILDEPVNGLDPAGILEFRGLIRSLVDEGRTVLLSSHLLDEVQRTCDAAAIVDQGHVVAQGSIEELTGAGERSIDVDVTSPVHAARILGGVDGVARTTVGAEGLRITLRPDAEPDGAMVTALLRRMLDADLAVRSIAPVSDSLEELFLRTTTRLEERV